MTTTTPGGARRFPDPAVALEVLRGQRWPETVAPTLEDAARRLERS